MNKQISIVIPQQEEKKHVEGKRETTNQSISLKDIEKLKTLLQSKPKALWNYLQKKEQSQDPK